MFITTVSCLGFQIPVSAIGMSSAINNSYIGQPLSVKIPLLNVSDPNNLIVTVKSNLVSSDDNPALNSKLDRSNSQLAIHVFSEQAVNEPYIELDININDSGTILNKQYQILLDPVSQALQESTTVANQAITVTTNKSQTVMGPYEWAKKGHVPEKFGAVLDGQSLWRVARRINGAMGVSRNQMMWALYEANPNAFATRSIGSLKSGSYLTIPNYDFVTKKTDSEAKQLIDKLANGSQTTANIESNYTSTSDVQTVEADESSVIEQSASTELPDSNFSISGSNNTKIEEAIFAPSQSQEIIKSLSDTVSRLTDELVNKDQQIAFLKNQMETLKELALTPPAKEAPSVIGTPVSVNNPEQKVVFEKQSLWPWLITAISLLLLLGSLLRTKANQLFTQLNLFGLGDKHLNFNLKDSAKPRHIKKISFKAKKRRKKKSSKQNKIKSTQNYDEDDSYIDYEFDNTQSIQVVDNVDFDDNFEKTLKDNDFVFAKNLIEFSRNNELNDEQYHLAQLRLSHAQNDEDGFYKYYNSIESQIPSFSQTTKTKISQLVVDLNENIIDQNSISQNSA